MMLKILNAIPIYGQGSATSVMFVNSPAIYIQYIHAPKFSLQMALKS